MFCNALYARGGWEALDEAFRHPPSSSAQVLHPELYLADPREEPLEIRFADLQIDGQKPAEDNVLGEFGAWQLFADWLHDKVRAEEAAAGWRGDRYLVYRSPAGTSYGWKIFCRNPAAATRFYEAVCDTNEARYHPEHLSGQKVTSLADQREGPSAPLLRAFAAGGRTVSVRLTPAYEVVVIDAQDTRWSEELTRIFLPETHSATP